MKQPMRRQTLSQTTLPFSKHSALPNRFARSTPEDKAISVRLSESRFDHGFSRIPLRSQVIQEKQEPTSPLKLSEGRTNSLSRSGTMVGRYPFRATLRCSQPKSSGIFRSDAPLGSGPDDQQFSALFERLAALPEGSLSAAGQRSTATLASAGSLGGATVSAPVSLPDIGIPALAAIDRNDAVNGAFNYSGSITRGGAAPSGFGVTRSFGSSLSGITITPGAGTFSVAATFLHPITYQVRSGTGPNSQVDIDSDSDNNIIATNYPTVVSDLTPNTSDLNGRPPRTQFWAEDLTLRHELVHANDDMANGPGAVTTVTTWLNGQTAASVAEVNALLGALPGRFANALLAALSTEDGEKHAYGDGAASYRARANAIKAKGDSGGYAAGGSGGLSRGAKTAIGIGGGALAGAGIGALAGGPLGAAIGAGVGALVGGLGSLLF